MVASGVKSEDGGLRVALRADIRESLVRHCASSCRSGGACGSKSGNEA